jgi:hypothetical protein
MNHGHKQIHKIHHDLDLGEATTFPLIVFSMISHNDNIHNDILSILKIGILGTLEGHNFFCKLSIRMRSQAKS